MKMGGLLGGLSTETGPDLARAKTELDAAIALHKQHMDGTAPTTGPDGEKSQMKMMMQMKSARKALGN